MLNKLFMTDSLMNDTFSSRLSSMLSNRLSSMLSDKLSSMLNSKLSSMLSSKHSSKPSSNNNRRYFTRNNNCSNSDYNNRGTWRTRRYWKGLDWVNLPKNRQEYKPDVSEWLNYNNNTALLQRLIPY